MRQMGIVILAMMFLFFGPIKAFSLPSGLGITADSPYNQAYVAYTKAARIKIGDMMSKKLDLAETGTVSLNFVLSSNGKLLQITVNNDRTKASQKMIDAAVQSVHDASPFGPFPDLMAKNTTLTFSIDLSLKPANAQL